MPTRETCPHCDGALASSEGSPGALGRCQQCGFVLPIIETAAGRRPESSPSESDESAGDLLVGASRYRPIRRLGGAPAEVYLVHHVHLDQLCVIKVIATAAAGGEVAVSRLIEEARAGFRVSHPHVVRVLDCDRLGERCYVTMEYVPGVDLGMALKTFGRLAWQQVAQIAVQAAEGLAAIHEAGLVHGDIKPSNLLLCPGGAVKISDLGLVQSQAARVGSPGSGQTTIFGTPQYMAPEQVSSDGDADGRADLYALGATLYHLLVGRPPRGDAGILELMAGPSKEAAAWPEEIADTVPDWLRQAIDRCLLADRESRWPSAAAFADAVRQPLSRLLARPLPVATLTRPPGVAVLAFRNLSGRSADDWIGEALAERVRTRLIASADVYVVDREEFAKLLSRRISPGEEALAGHVRSVARLLGAALVIQGTFESPPEGLRATAEVMDLERRQQRVLASTSGSIDRVLGADDSFARQVVDALSLPSAEAAPDANGFGGTASAKAEEQYARGLREFANGEYARAAKLAREALEWDPDYFDPVSFIGGCYARLGQYDEALTWHRKAEQSAMQSGNADRLAEVLNNLGVMCYYRGDYADAQDYLNRSKEIETKRSLLPARAKTWNNLGFVLLRRGQLQQAEQAFAASAELSRQLGSLAHLVGPYNGLGNVLLQQERYEEAANYFRRALNLAGELDERVKIGVAHINLCRCSALMRQYDQALAESRRAEDTLRESGFWNGLLVVYELLGDLYILLGRLDDALAVIEKRLRLAREHENRRMESSAWEQKAHVHQQAGRTGEAMECLKMALKISGSPATGKDLQQYLNEVVSRPPFLRRTSVGE